MTGEIWQIFTRALESVKIETLWDPLVQSRKCMTYKFTEELCIMILRNDKISEEELACRFKINIKNLTDFDQSTGKSHKFSL